MSSESQKYTKGSRHPQVEQSGDRSPTKKDTITICGSLSQGPSPKRESHVRDTTLFLNIIQHLEYPLLKDIILVTLDILSLYTTIPNKDGI